MIASFPGPRAGRTHLSRRSLLGGGLGAATIVALRPLTGRAAPFGQVVAPLPAPPALGSRRTWLLDSPAELRPAAPAAPTAAEVDELLALQARRTARMAEAIARWGTGPAVLPWTAVALDLIQRHKPSPPRAARALALLHAAAHDTAVATLDARSAHRRPAPTAAPTLEWFAKESGPFSFPSEHAAIAAAAAAILTGLFPDEPAEMLDDLAGQAARSRLEAGAAYRSDVDAGVAIGRAVADRALGRAAADGADAVWDGNRPGGEGIWQPTPPKYADPPLEPLAGTWRTWVAAVGAETRPAPPPAWGSAAWRAEVAAVREAVTRRTPEQETAVHFWAGGPGTVTPAGIWTEIAGDLIRRDRLDSVAAARVLALTSVAVADAFACCWDAKYAYWYARPVTADPTLNVLIPTPPFPSYTSGHATVSAAAATTLGHLFPADEAHLRARAAEAKDSRLWAGIHYPLDNDAGAAMGDLVGRLVAEVARHDGAA